jgi:glycosyltransferase involved in cell wall biosynthesis
MKLVIVTYAHVAEYNDPVKWLERIGAVTGILEALSGHCKVFSLHNINFEGLLKINGVDYLFVRQTGASKYFPFKIHAAIKKIDPDAVIVQGFNAPLQLIQLRSYVNKHCRIYVQHRAEKPGKGIKAALQKIADRYIAAYLFASAPVASRWVEAGIIRNERKICEVMGASSVFQQINKDEARGNMRIPGDPVFLWVGRLNANKDPVTVVKSFLQYAGGNARARLYLVYQSGELLQQLKAICADHPSCSSINFCGKIPHDEMGHWYNAADFIICSSFYEGGNVSVLEGMSCGCIPIVTDIESFKLHTDHGKIGLLFQPGDQMQLLGCLEKTGKLDIDAERIKVLEYFNAWLSFKAIASQVFHLVQEVAVEQ